MADNPYAAYQTPAGADANPDPYAAYKQPQQDQQGTTGKVGPEPSPEWYLNQPHAKQPWETDEDHAARVAKTKGIAKSELWKTGKDLGSAMAMAPFGGEGLIQGAVEKGISVLPKAARAALGGIEAIPEAARAGAGSGMVGGAIGYGVGGPKGAAIGSGIGEMVGGAPVIARGMKRGWQGPQEQFTVPNAPSVGFKSPETSPTMPPPPVTFRPGVQPPPVPPPPVNMRPQLQPEQTGPPPPPVTFRSAPAAKSVVPPPPVRMPRSAADLAPTAKLGSPPIAGAPELNSVTSRTPAGPVDRTAVNNMLHHTAANLGIDHDMLGTIARQRFGTKSLTDLSDKQMVDLYSSLLRKDIPAMGKPLNLKSTGQPSELSLEDQLKNSLEMTKKRFVKGSGPAEVPPDDLTKYAKGGVIQEPHYLVDAKTGKPDGLMAEAGPEKIVPMTTAERSTVPEIPATIKIQLEQLAQGLRKVVMFPAKTQLEKKPKGMEILQTASKNTYFFNPKLISSKEIDAAEQSNNLPSVLGAADKGMGAPDKSEIEGPPVAVVARDDKGETAQATATDAQHLPDTVAQTAKVTPPDGTVAVEPPEAEIAHRFAEQQGSESEDDASNSEEPKHDYSSTQVQLPPSVASGMLRFSENIPNEDLTPEDGREDDAHITVKFGLHDDGPEAITKLRALLAGEPPIKATLGKTSLFENDDADVLKVDIRSPDLARINKKIAEELPNTDTHPEYEPHATIAYLKPGKGKLYDGQTIPGATGTAVTFSSIRFSGKDGQQTDIPLGGAQVNATKPVAAPEKKPPAQASKPYQRPPEKRKPAASEHRQAPKPPSQADTLRSALQVLASTPLPKLIDVLASLPPQARRAAAPTIGHRMDREMDGLNPAEQQAVIAKLVKLGMLKNEAEAPPPPARFKGSKMAAPVLGR